MMFFSEINIDEPYFYMPFGPVELKLQDIGLTRCLCSNRYIDKSTGLKWKRCFLYDTGWGQPLGFERLPRLTFPDLMKLALQSNSKTTRLTMQQVESNRYGAVAIIMERYVEDLIDFLHSNLDNDVLFNDGLYQENLRLFCFDEKQSLTQGYINGKSYEFIFGKHERWQAISDEVKQKVYGSVDRQETLSDEHKC